MDEPDLERARRRDPAPEEDQLLGARLADEPRQPLGAARARHDAQPDLGEADLRALDEDSEVARERQLQPTAVGRAVHRRDRRLAELADAVDRARDRVDVRAGLGRGHATPLLEVGAGADACPPAPVITTARTASSGSRSLAISWSRRLRSRDSALRTAGRLSVIHAAAPRLSNKTSSCIVYASSVTRPYQKLPSSAWPRTAQDELKGADGTERKLLVRLQPRGSGASRRELQIWRQRRRR